MPYVYKKSNRNINKLCSQMKQNANRTRIRAKYKACCQ